jgi:uncharacterized protein (TIGR00730 family)
MKSICVFCGSNMGSDAAYAQAARLLGSELVHREIELVYGGGSVGLMGVIADHVLELGGRATGVIPQSLLDREVGHRALTKLHVVSTMHERKALMNELADGFIALPGGLGTLEELFEVWTWAQLGIHGKPVGLLNVGGFFDPLLVFLRRAVDERFLHTRNLDMLLVDDEPGVLIKLMTTYHPPSVDKWLKPEET